MIEKGMYIRTKDGIKKVLDVGEYLGIKQYLINDNGTYVIDNSIIKYSDNIIDLIEVGDVVKTDGGAIVMVSIKFEILKFFSSDGDEYLYDEIKSIVTKEQFKKMEYKL